MIWSFLGKAEGSDHDAASQTASKKKEVAAAQPYEISLKKERNHLEACILKGLLETYISMRFVGASFKTVSSIG